METGYQRGRIQEESLFYEHKKHDGSLPIIGVNTFLGKEQDDQYEIELARSTDEEKQSQIRRLREFQGRDPEQAEAALVRIKQAVTQHQNGFEALMDAVRHCSLGQITDTLFEVGRSVPTQYVIPISLPGRALPNSPGLKPVAGGANRYDAAASLTKSSRDGS